MQIKGAPKKIIVLKSTNTKISGALAPTGGMLAPLTGLLASLKK